MRLTVRYITRRPNGGVAQSEKTLEVDGNRVTLGCGTNNHVYLKDKELRVNYEHAELLLRDGRAIMHALAGSPLRVGKKVASQAELDERTQVDIGPYRIARLPAEPGSDLVLAVELVAPHAADTPERLVAKGGLRLHQTWASRRLMSWLFFLLLGVLTLALPVYAFYTPKPKPRPGVEATPPPLATFDKYWITGELSRGHRFLTNNCAACHDKPFTPTASETCASCHQYVQHHFDVAKFTFAGFDPTGCTGCHSEHVRPPGVIPVHQELCAGCHQDLDQKAPETTLLNASDFGTDHPQFRPSVLVDPMAGTIARVALGAPDFPKERSNLRFPHDVHMAETGVNSPNGRRRLRCGDCHVPEPGGVGMLPIRMDKNCAGCHRLQFDKDAPQRVLPHGRPDEVIAVVNDYYAAKALRETAIGAPRPVPPPAQEPGVRRRAGVEAPGARTRGQAQEQARPRSPLPDAEFVSEQTLRNIFGRSLCGVCHVTTPPEESPRGVWEVQPSRVVSVWMPKAKFDHGSHRTIDCVDCHKALTSKTAEDVLMPPIASCRTCHQGEHALAAVPSTCIMCHDYHRQDLGPMIVLPVEAAAPMALDAPSTANEPAAPAGGG